MGRYVLAGFVGALILAFVFEIVIHAANLEITDNKPASPNTTYQVKPGQITSSTITPFNLVYNPNADFGIGGWGTISGTLKSVPSSKHGVVGPKAFQLTPKSQTTTASAYAHNFKVQPGEDLTASAYMVSVPSPGTAQMTIDWKTAGGDYISSSSPGKPTTRSGTRIYVSATAPNSAGLADVIVNLLGAKPSSNLEFDAVVAEKAG